MNRVRVGEVDTHGDGGNGPEGVGEGGGGGAGEVDTHGDGRNGPEGVGEGGGGGADRSNAVKALLGAITETVIVGSTTYYPIAKSLPGALSVAYAALFLTVLLFLLVILLILLYLPRRSGSGGSDDAGEGGGRAGGSGGGGAVKFAKGAAVSVMFLVPLLALAAKAYAALNSK